MMQRGRGRVGFTLVEVIVVIVIMGIVLAVMLPNMRGPGEREALSAATRELAAAAMLARQQAISSAGKARLRFDIENKRWRIVLPDRVDDRGRAEEDREPSSFDNRWRSLPKGVSWSRFLQGGDELSTGRNDTIEVVFYPNGTSSGLTIELLGRTDRMATIEFAAVTGRVATYRGPAKSLDDRLAEEAARLADARGEASAGDFYTVGRTEEERVSAYKSVVDRLVADQRRQWEMSTGGVDAATYFANQEAGGSSSSQAGGKR